ncbi:tetratricopeptide repeat protein [Aquimarina celericrescens]|uniref:Tetratricopeptide repeat protein n=1 Tax=Aquimarina celericrescens TaxID=1964542 RepID=A0ABW5AXG2_9FLAO|nr:tetratricopeptide repeat protein [Aquimarina celericrescens]
MFYLNKGASYGIYGNFKKAIDNYLEVIKWSTKQKNDRLLNIAIHNIGSLKKRLGKYKEAKVLFKRCMSQSIDKDKMTRGDTLRYLGNMHDLIHTYRLSNQIDSMSIFNKQGLVFSKKEEIKCLFELNDLILKYYKGEYSVIITQADTIVLEMLKPKNRYFLWKSDLINAYLYQGKSYEALSDTENAIKYYKKIDSIVHVSNYVVPETRWVYKRLIQHHKSLGDRDQQLVYIDKLLRSDSILYSNHKYVSDKLIKEYDTPNLLKEKERLIASLEGDKKRSSGNVLVLSLFLLVNMGGCWVLLL